MERLARVSALTGGLLSLATAMLVTASVLSRWLLRQPIPGDFEFVQIATALSVFGFLPLCQWHRGNILVDTFTTKLPSGWRRAIDAAWDLIYAGVAALLAIGLLIGSREAMVSNTTTMVLGLPIWPAIAVCGVLCAVLALVALATAARLLRAPS